MALPTTAAPTTPAAMPKPRPRPLASAWVAVVATVPVTASAASERAAILVLNDMGCSILLAGGPILAGMPISRSPFESGSIAHANFRIVNSEQSSMVNLIRSDVGTVCEAGSAKFVDIGEQFAECARTLIEQSLAHFGGRPRGIADGATRMKVLRLPGKGRRAVRGKPAIIRIHCDAGGAKVGNLVGAHVLRIACQHDRRFDCAAMNAVAQFLREEQVLRRTETIPSRCHRKQAMSGAKVLRDPRHGRAVAAVACHHLQFADAGARATVTKRIPGLQCNVGRQGQRAWIGD